VPGATLRGRRTPIATRWLGRPPDRGIDHEQWRRDDSAMDSPSTPRGLPQATDFEARLQALLKIRHEMEMLHARLEYVRLLLKLGVRIP